VLIILLIKSSNISGQTWVKPWSNPLMSMPISRTFSAFSKFCLNTSKSANIKVVRCFEGHNFPNWRHFRFWSIGAQKLSQRSFEVFWIMENPELRHAFQAKPFTKTYVSLYKCCRGMSHIQLSYLAFLSRSSKFWRKIAVKPLTRWLLTVK
jgi:hypothetical protein